MTSRREAEDALWSYLTNEWARDNTEGRQYPLRALRALEPS